MKYTSKGALIFLALIAAILSFFTQINGSNSATTSSPQLDWQLTWEDEFTGSNLNDEKWSLYTRGNHDWKNTMSEAPRLLKIEDGLLHLSAIINDKPGKAPAAYLTAGITSEGKFSYKYGKVVIRARFKSAQGAWPALWSLGDKNKWPANGEIDLMEHLNFDHKVYQTVHSEYTDKDPAEKNGGATNINPYDWNTYGSEWDENKIVFTVNGKPTHVYLRLPEKGEKQWPFNQPFYFIFSMQERGGGGNQSGSNNSSHNPASMEVDWVRVYKKSVSYREGMVKGISYQAMTVLK